LPDCSSIPIHRARSLARVASTVAEDLGCKLIVCFTESGATARVVSSFRPRVPIAALTYNEEVHRQLSLWWGVIPLKTQFAETTDQMMVHGQELLRSRGIAAPGDGTKAGLTAPATFSLLAPAYGKKFGVDDATLKDVMTRIAWKNHKNGALNPRAQFRKEVPKDTIACSPLVAGPLGIFDCSGVSDGSAAAIIVRAEDARRYTGALPSRQIGLPHSAFVESKWRTRRSNWK